MYSVKRLAADNAVASPMQGMTLTADALTLTSPTLGDMDIFAPAPSTCMINLVGPGGRDQPAAFAAGATVWFYYIAGLMVGARTQLSTLVSANPPSIGPVLPGAFTSFCPAFPMLIADDGSLGPRVFQYPINQPNLYRTNIRVRGDHAYFGSAVYYDFQDVFTTAPRPFSLAAVLPVGVALVDILIDAEVHQVAGGGLVGGFVMEWLDATDNDVNLSLYEYITPTSFPIVNNVVAAFPINANLMLWATLLASCGAISSSDCGFMIRGYSW